ncbi:MAG: MucR family transcriptional regulator [Robiginitomaculum sp.]|nr:MucR family transcriptional regulator [Robiginitomaculum sp.]
MDDKENLLELTTDLVAAYVSNNTIEPDALPGLISSVYQALEQTMLEEETAEKPVPAVPIDQSVGDDGIVCLEDGQSYKSLKRHLRTQHGMTPKVYREKWGLPADYPMVALNYSKERSRLAKRTGLGKS